MCVDRSSSSEIQPSNCSSSSELQSRQLMPSYCKAKYAQKVGVKVGRFLQAFKIRMDKNRGRAGPLTENNKAYKILFISEI